MKKRIFLALLARKNKQIRSEREKNRALEETNKILCAYVGLLVEKCGGVKIPKSLLADSIGGFNVSVGQSDDCYLISVESQGKSAHDRAIEGIRTQEG